MGCLQPPGHSNNGCIGRPEHKRSSALFRPNTMPIIYIRLVLLSALIWHSTAIPAPQANPSAIDPTALAGALVSLAGVVTDPNGPFASNGALGINGALGPGCLADNAAALQPDGPFGVNGTFGPNGQFGPDGPFGPSGPFGPNGQVSLFGFSAFHSLSHIDLWYCSNLSSRRTACIAMNVSHRTAPFPHLPSRTPQRHSLLS